MTTPIFYIQDGELNFGDKNIFQNIELYIYPGDKICLVGRNGCGKSSLMKIITSEYELDSGELFCDKKINFGYLKQDLDLKLDVSIYDYILQESGLKEEERYQIDMILNGLEIDGSLILNSCSGGQIRRCFLATALVKKPDILLLDEPTNHLDIKAILWLEEYLINYEGAFICISHDKTFQSNVTNKLWWLDRGLLRTNNKGFKFYDKWRDEVIKEEEAKLKNMNRKLEVEKSWLNTGVTARRKRNQRRLYQLHKLRESLNNHQDKLSDSKRKLKIELDKEVKKSKFIIEAKNISYSYQNLSKNSSHNKDNHPKNLIEDFNIKIKKGEKIGIIGANGCGKSSLIKLLMKELEPQEGIIKTANNLDITYFDQHRSILKHDDTLKETICPGCSDTVFMQDKTLHVAAYLKQFMFDPKIINSKVASLSGGEANRLLLAKILIKPGNLLILDEPTNDLDSDSLEILLEILSEYQGTLIIISHDRDFLEQLITRILVFEDDKIVDLYGGYNDYLSSHKKLDKTDKSQIANKNQDNNKIKKQEQEQNKGTNQEKNKNIKLSYKYQRLLELLPKEIEQIEEEIKLLEHKLSEPDLYDTNPEEFQLLSKQLLSLNKQLEDKMNEWLKIENMK